MNKHNNLLSAAVALSFLGGAASGAYAQTWAKTGTPGNTPATAQITAGVGPLTTITGTLVSSTTGTERTVAEPSNPDLFEIYITGTGLFSATTLAPQGYTLPGNTLFNPRLFLFDSSGSGLFYNDDASATAPNGHQSQLNLTKSLTPGLYYLGVGTFGAIPRNATGTTSSANDIFPDPVDDSVARTTPTTGLIAATGPGAGGPLASWFISSTDVETGSYKIALTGATFAAAPEPPQTVALGLGLIGVCALRAWRRKRSPTA